MKSTVFRLEYKCVARQAQLKTFFVWPWTNRNPVKTGVNLKNKRTQSVADVDIRHHKGRSQ